MKYHSILNRSFFFYVTPYGGVWIEIFLLMAIKNNFHVTPCGGVWIEIIISLTDFGTSTCHALWRRVD